MTAPGEIELLLPYRPPYDWPVILAFLGQRAIAGVESIVDGRYARSIRLDGMRGWVAIEPAPGNALRARVAFSLSAALPAITARLRRQFDLDADPAAIAAHLGTDPVMAPLVAARPGLRVPGAWDGFELAIRAVLGQQITVFGARGLAGKLVAAHGEPLVEPAHGLTHVFPQPERLAAAGLAALGMPRGRAAALSAVAAAVVEDRSLLDPAGDHAESVRRLRAIRGVGDWTAQYIALRQLRDPDAFPDSDIGLLRAMARCEGRPFSPAGLRLRAETWRPWRAYAAQHLWTSD